MPAFNEERALGEVLSRLAALPLPARVFVIDDGSSDATARTARSRGASVISHLINLGYARAVRTGIRFALDAGFDYCVTFDADGQHDPASLWVLLERASREDRPDIVIGSRFVAAGSYAAPLGRRLGMTIFSLLTRSVTGQRIHDTTSGLKWMSRRAMRIVAGLSGGDLHSEMIIYSLVRGLKVVEVPVVMTERRVGESMYGAVSALIYPLKTLVSILVLFVQARQEGQLGDA